MTRAGSFEAMLMTVFTQDPALCWLKGEHWPYTWITERSEPLDSEEEEAQGSKALVVETTRVRKRNAVKISMISTVQWIGVSVSWCVLLLAIYKKPIRFINHRNTL